MRVTASAVFDVIRGTMCNLRAVDRSDLDDVLAWLDDPELMRFWGYGATAMSRSAAIQRIEAWLAGEESWGHPIAFIVETIEHLPCGLLELSSLSPTDRSAELSIVLKESARQQGFGSDALEAIVDVAFDQWNLHRLTVHCEAHNQGAQAFFLQHGFEAEGRLREARYLDGSWQDILIFGRLQDDHGAKS